MNKIYLLFLLILSSYFSNVAIAASVSSSLQLTLQGIVTPFCYFSINNIFSASGNTPSTVSASLTLNAVSEVPATGTIYCNDPNGYTVTVASQNNALLKSPTTSSTISYELKFNGTIVIPTISPTLLYSVSSLSSPEIGISKPIEIDYLGGIPSAHVFSGTYSDTIIFTLIGN
jgi:hypothetical protein